MKIIKIIHADGCGKEAFSYVSDRLIIGASIIADYTILPNGEFAMPGDPLICYSCGNYITVSIEKEKEKAKAYNMEQMFGYKNTTFQSSN